MYLLCVQDIKIKIIAWANIYFSFFCSFICVAWLIVRSARVVWIIGYMCVHTRPLLTFPNPRQSLLKRLCKMANVRQKKVKKKPNIAVSVDTCCHSSWHGQNARGQRPPHAADSSSYWHLSHSRAGSTRGNLENIVKLCQQLRQQTSTRQLTDDKQFGENQIQISRKSHTHT